MVLPAAVAHRHQDPWIASSFITAVFQIIISLLVLLHTFLVYFTLQVVKCYSLWHSLETYFTGEQRNSDPCAYEDTLLSSKEKCLNFSGSNNTYTTKSLFCPKCREVWNVKAFLSFKYDKVGAVGEEEASTNFDEGGLSSATKCYVDAGLKCLLDSSRCRLNESNDWSGTLTRACSVLETECKNAADVSVSSSRRRPPYSRSLSDAKASSRIGIQQAKNVSYLETSGENEIPEVDQSSGTSRGNLMKGILAGKYRSDMDLESSMNDGRLETQDEICDDDTLSMQNRVINDLRQALQREREKLSSLYAELEVERVASETAANETLSKILHLQEEKSSLQMQAAHYQRMAEQKATHDEHAMQVLKEILYKKERENYFLEKEVKLIRTRLSRETRKGCKRRIASQSTPSFFEGDSLQLLKSPGDLVERQDVRMITQGVESEVDDASANVPFLSWNNGNEQPLKKLKGLTVLEMVEDTVLPPEYSAEQHQSNITLSSDMGSGNVQVGASDNTDEEAISPLDNELVLSEQEQKKSMDFLSRLDQCDTASETSALDACVEDKGEVSLHLFPLGHASNHTPEKEHWMEFHSIKADEKAMHDFCNLPSQEAEVSCLHGFCEVNGAHQTVNGFPAFLANGLHPSSPAGSSDKSGVNDASSGEVNDRTLGSKITTHDALQDSPMLSELLV